MCSENQIRGLLGGVEHFDEFFEEDGVVGPGAGGNEVAGDDEFLIEIGGVALFYVEFAFGDGGELSAFDDIGGGEYFDTVAE